MSESDSLGVWESSLEVTCRGVVEEEVGETATCSEKLRSWGSCPYKFPSVCEVASQSRLLRVLCIIWLFVSRAVVSYHSWAVKLIAFIVAIIKSKMTIEVSGIVEAIDISALRIDSDNLDFILESDYSLCLGEEALYEALDEEAEDVKEERRDSSDSSDVSSTDGASSDDLPEISQEIAERIIAQVESMFSDEHLAKDGFLLKHVRRRSDGFVSLKLVAGLRKVKQISREFPIVLTALRKSEKLEVNWEGTKIRRLDPLTPFLKSIPTTSQTKEVEKKNVKIVSAPTRVPTNGGNSKKVNPPVRNQHHYHRSNSPTYGSYSSGAENSDDSSFPHAYNHQQQQNKNYYGNNKTNHQQQQNHKRQPNNYNTNISNSWQTNGSNSTMAKQGCPDVVRRRGGSLPIPTGKQQQRGSLSLSPHSPPNGPSKAGDFGGRPKSFSYCEGAESMISPWLQRRQAAWRNSEGSLTLSGVIRQPRGPDGTKGFAPRTQIPIAVP